jgi:hypothetical protein
MTSNSLALYGFCLCGSLSLTHFYRRGAQRKENAEGRKEKWNKKINKMTPKKTSATSAVFLSAALCV